MDDGVKTSWRDADKLLKTAVRIQTKNVVSAITNNFVHAVQYSRKVSAEVSKTDDLTDLCSSVLFHFTLSTGISKLSILWVQEVSYGAAQQSIGIFCAGCYRAKIRH